MVQQPLRAGADPVERPFEIFVGSSYGGVVANSPDYSGGGIGGEIGFAFRRWQHWSIGARLATMNDWDLDQIESQDYVVRIRTMSFFGRWFPWAGDTLPYLTAAMGPLNHRIKLRDLSQTDDYASTIFGLGLGCQHWFGRVAGIYIDGSVMTVARDGGSNPVYGRVSLGLNVRF